MSSIDERIVSAQFDNRHFEDNVQTTIKSLDKLKSGLNLDSSARSLSNLERVGNSFSLAGMSNGIDTLVSRFSNLGIVGITVLQDITNSALNAGKRIMSALTIDPVKSGLTEYETKMNSITTILTNTASKGTTLDEVNKALAELNTYADKTIYNFAEMTRNIGTFTAAGIDLKTSTQSIKGIANLAAGSGSSAAQASTAMYQLSQALASGSVKLQDWNSVVNAGMGGELFQNALKDSAKELGIFVNASVPFRESLKDGWLTSEVLTNTLSKFAEDESLLKAATQVKTFTQLLDTMKESVQSGWAVSWENIIGDKDTAAATFTAINDAFSSVVGASADARNAMLAFWNANGGRQALLEGLGHALTGISSILAPIEEGFRDIFPAMTGERLVELTKGFRDLMSGFKIGEDTSENLKRTFRGLFALIDIGKQAIFALGNGIGSIIKYVLPAGDGLLSFTGNVGDLLVALDNAIKSSDAFNSAIQKVGNFMKPIADGVKTAVTTIINAIRSFGNVDTSGLDSFSDRVKVRFEPFTKLGDLMSNVFSKIANVVKKLAPIFYKLSSIIGGEFNNLRESIVGALDNAEFNSIFDIVNGGLFAGILFGLKKFIGSLTDITDGAGGFLKHITGILDGVKGSLESYQSSLKANTLLKIAVAMGVLSMSLVALSLIDSDKLTSSLAAMTAMFADLFGSMAIFEKLMGADGFKGMGKMTLALMGLSVAILILSVAMGNLAKLDWEGIDKGLTAVAVLSGILIGSAKLLEKNSGSLIRGSVGFVIFAGAILVLTSAVEKLGALDAGELAKGLVGVGVVAAELALFMKTTDMNKMGVTKGLGLLVLASAILVLASAVEKFSQLDSGSLIKGLSAVGIVLSELAVFVNLTGDSKRVITTAIGLTILGASMLIFASAIGKMGDLSWEQIGKGLVTMAGALGIITVAIDLMPKGMIAKATGLVIIAGALVILSKALTTMGSMTWEEIARGLVTLAGALTIIAGALTFMTSALPGAAALLVVAGALAILAPTLLLLGSMSLTEIGLGLIALAGAFAVIGIAGLVLAPITPILLALSVAVGLLGIGCLAVGAGLLAFSAGLTALAISGAAGSAALVLAVTSIVGLIPMVAEALAQGLINFIRVIGDGSIAIADSTVKLVLAIVAGLSDTVPVVIDAVFKLLSQILKTMLDYVPTIVKTGMKIIIGFLKGISDNIQAVVETAIKVVVNFIKGVASQLPDIIQAGFDLMISFINGMADGIDKNTDLVLDAMGNLIMAMLGIGGKLVGRFIDYGKNIVEGIINGITGMASKAIDAVKNLGASILDAAKNTLGIHSPSVLFKEMGDNLVKGMAIGIDDNSHKAVKSSENMAKNVSKASSKVITKSNEDAKKSFDKSVEWINDRKYYNKLSLEEELKAWQDIQSQYRKGTEERKQADKEVYRVKKELRKSDYDDAVDTISDLKYYNKLTLDEELKYWQDIQKKYKKGTDEREQADKETYRLRKEIKKDEYNDAVEEINNLKYYNKMSLGQELTAWMYIQSKYKKGTEERKQADKEVYRVKKEMTEKLTKLDEDYQANSKAINDKSIADIKALNDAYDQAVKSRADAIYSAYNLFDKVETPEAVSGQELITNLNSQVTAIEEWSKQIAALADKGIADDLLKELENMGPSAIAQVTALNTLTPVELDKYVTLWAEKTNAARLQATTELEKLKADTKTKISDINAQTKIDLEALTKTWKDQITEIMGTTDTSFAKLGTTVNTRTNTMVSDTKKAFTGMAKAIKNINWDGVGVDIVDGIRSGILSKSESLAKTTANTALKALNAAKKALGIHSPSKEFAEVGAYSGEGMIVGLNRLSGAVANTAASVGEAAMTALTGSVAGISDIINGTIDGSPTIRPVVDLSDITSSNNLINSMFGSRKSRSVQLAGSIVQNGMGQPTVSDTSGSGSVASPISNLFNIPSLVVREEADIKKIARELYNLQLSGSRG